MTPEQKAEYDRIVNTSRIQGVVYVKDHELTELNERQELTLKMGNKLGQHKVMSLATAQKMFVQMREASGLGGSGFDSGLIFKKGEKVPFAFISYNGRVWHIASIKE